MARTVFEPDKTYVEQKGLNISNKTGSDKTLKI